MEILMPIISLGADHAGYTLKEIIKKHLIDTGFEILDFGTFSKEPVDYPDYIIPAAECVSLKKANYGIVFGGSGNGEAISANKVKGIRCALCWNIESAELAKKHNNANMISIGARMVKLEDGIKIVDVWLNTIFENDRHTIRIVKIDNYENRK
jgi:ribose 5-phosphate isomerase B